MTQHGTQQQILLAYHTTYKASMSTTQTCLDPWSSWKSG